MDEKYGEYLAGLKKVFRERAYQKAFQKSGTRGKLCRLLSLNEATVRKYERLGAIDVPKSKEDWQRYSYDLLNLLYWLSIPGNRISKHPKVRERARQVRAYTAAAAAVRAYAGGNLGENRGELGGTHETAH